MAMEPLTATNYHDLAVVASRYVALRYDDATDESVAIYSVAADGTLALEDTWAGTGISDDMAVWQNKIILGRSSGANAVTSLVVAADGTVSAGTVYRIDPGPVLVADATTGGNGVKDVEVGDGIVFCWNATEQVIGVWTMDISTGDLVRAQTPAFPFDPTDGVNWPFLDITNTSGKGKDVMKYLGGGYTDVVAVFVSQCVDQGFDGTCVTQLAKGARRIVETAR